MKTEFYWRLFMISHWAAIVCCIVGAGASILALRLIKKSRKILKEGLAAYDEAQKALMDRVSRLEQNQRSGEPDKI